MSENKPQAPNPNTVLFTCPLLSANSEYNKMCVQDRCAWYMKSTRTCAVAIMAHESIMRIKNMQTPKPNTENK